MKKQLVIIGIVAILFTVGLSGCTGNNLVPTSEISISELKLYPEKYENKIVKIFGGYSQTYGGTQNYTVITLDLVIAGDGYLPLDFSKITKPGVQNGIAYYFTGKFVKNTDLKYKTYGYWVLEVTNVEST